MAIVPFSYYAEEALSFADSTHLSKAALRAKIAGIEYMGGQTYTHKAMEMALDIFDVDGRQTWDVAKFLVVLTDGNSNNAYRVHYVVPWLIRMDVQLVAIGVGSAVNADKLRLLAGGDAAIVFAVDSFDQLDSLVPKMAEMLCHFFGW